MKKYEVFKLNEMSPEVIKRTEEDGTIWWIPIDPANSDYQAYLEHLTEIVSE